MRAITEIDLPENVLATARQVCRNVSAKYATDHNTEPQPCVERGHLCVRCENMAREKFDLPPVVGTTNEKGAKNSR